MRKLIRLELERFSIKPHLIGLLIANIIILLLCVMVSTFIKALGGVMAAAGLPDFSLTTVNHACTSNLNRMARSFHCKADC